jgi:uncharacterized membrane protein YqjE
MANERPFGEVFQDIVRNLQEIVRSEIRLAKVELRADAAVVAASAIWLSAGIVAALSALSFLLWTIAYALATVMPLWGAALSTALGLAIAASILLTVGLRKFKHVQMIPERTVDTLKENAQWVKHPSR